MKYHTKVAGVTFEGRQEIIKNLENGTPVVFERDPENKYDSKAVKVIAEGKQIGFLPRGNWVADQMDQGFRFTAEISRITGGGPGMSYGVNVDYEVVKHGTVAPRTTATPPVVKYSTAGKPETEITRLWDKV